MSAHCPHCGGNTAPGAAVRRGKWWVAPIATFYDGDQVAMPRYLSRTLYTIARANGRPVTHRDFPNITPQTLAGHISQLRRLFGEKLPIRGVTNKGYAWEARA